MGHNRKSILRPNLRSTPDTDPYRRKIMGPFSLNSSRSTEVDLENSTTEYGCIFKGKVALIVAENCICFKSEDA